MSTPAASPSVAGLVLAAGASTRMRRAKAALEVDGAPMLARVLRALKAGGTSACWVVVGPPHDTVATPIATNEGATVVRNPDPSRGMLSSLRAGLAELEDRTDVAAVAVALVDHPHLRGATVRSVIDAFVRSGATVVRPWVATPTGRRHGHPYVLARAAWPTVIALGDVDGGMRTVLASLADSTEHVEVTDDAILEDVDTPEDLAPSRAQ